MSTFTFFSSGDHDQNFTWVVVSKQFTWFALSLQKNKEYLYNLEI